MDDILPTVLLNISKGNQPSTQCRAILDTASTKNFIVENLASFLNLPRERCEVPIQMLNGSYTTSQYRVTATIMSRRNKYRKKLDFLVVPTITECSPDTPIARKSLNIPPNLQLADPEFHKPAAVQLLLASGATLDALSIGQFKLSARDEPDLILQKTQYGWVVGGSVPVYQKSVRGIKCFFTDAQEDISRFWELEDSQPASHRSVEELACEDHFIKHIRRDASGRYVAALPFNHKRDDLGESYNMALKRLTSLERRFKKDGNLEGQYRKAMQDHVDRGYLAEVHTRSLPEYFIPHQPVFKKGSLTTQLRTVFDASAASSSGVSLNDALLAGPTIQDNIFALLLRFRIYRYVLTGDIEKMYLQIKIREEDQPYLRILWREKDGTLRIYQFNRLIFGLKPASYIATKCLHRLAEDECARFPEAAKILKRDLYVDDLLTGADSLTELAHLQKELTCLLNEGGFNLRQCASNSKEILQAIPDRCVNLQLHDANNATLKTLGVHWDSTNDRIVYTVQPITERKITKRIIFSEVAKIYDPLGLLNPVVVNAKLLIQELWKLGVHWDEALPAVIHTKWQSFVSNLPALNDMSFDRQVLQNRAKDVELHGFCDASERAYGACIYLTSVDSSGVTSASLLCAKSRVAPIKTVQTIPRLELCAALLLANLYNNIKAALPTHISRTTFWTDSMITFHWINTSPHLLKNFVANRVSSIQSSTNPEDWRHVRTHENPADLLSRGVTAEELKSSVIWFQGPSWLAGGESMWPPRPTNKHAGLPEQRSITCLIASLDDPSILHRYSSLTRLQRIVALCRRVIPGNRNKGLITADELRMAIETILKLVQKGTFATEYEQLMKGKPVSASSRLRTLSPFIGDDGLIRVGGRLSYANLSYFKKHPVILPKSHHVTTLILEKTHLECLHGGIQTTLSAVRQSYWPIDGRNQVRKIIRACTRCTRAHPPPVDYVMGDLPSSRTTIARPFTNAGVDYCGPFFIKEKKFRNRNKIKTYVAIFVCLSTKAVHLEVVSDLSSEAFIAALKRFISRRGKCITMASDNGTNFVGANNELKELHELLSSEKHREAVYNYLADKGITSKFIPPRSPHCGGLWEAAVKSFKGHLKRVVNTDLFTFEQFNTLVIEIEAILNSRPLTPLSSDPNDLAVLTPAHFLIGDSLSGLPEANLSGIANNRLSTWQHIQKVKRDFWVRWQTEYLHELNVRRKWSKGDHTLHQGSIVLIRDDNSPPMQWRMGRIIETYPGKDGVIRTVRVKTSGGELIRNVKGLTPLLEENVAEPSRAQL